eukprot:scaffold91259_cov35-Phaeocystis_antarctica.AAC.1
MVGSPVNLDIKKSLGWFISTDKPSLKMSFASRLASRACHKGTCSWRSARPAVQHRPCDGLQPLLSILSRTLGCAQLQLRL